MFNVPIELIRASNPSQLCKRTGLSRDGYVGRDPRRSKTARGVTALTRKSGIPREGEQGTGRDTRLATRLPKASTKHLNAMPNHSDPRQPWVQGERDLDAQRGLCKQTSVPSGRACTRPCM